MGLMIYFDHTQKARSSGKLKMSGERQEEKENVFVSCSIKKDSIWRDAYSHYDIEDDQVFNKLGR